MSGSRPRPAGACSATCSPRDRHRDRHPGAAARHRDVVRAGRQRRRLRLDVPAQEHPPVAAQPARQRRRRLSSRATTASTPTATGRRSGATTRRAPSDDFGSDTYRGPSPQSEPEVSSLDAMFAQAQAEVPARLPHVRAADPVPGGLAGRDATAPTRRRRPGARGPRRRPPGDHELRSRTSPASSTRPTATSPATSTTRYGSLAYTVELEPRQRPGRRRHGRRAELVPPRRLRLPGLRGRRVEAEFQRNLQFALDLARSAKNPGRPVSHLGNVAPDFVPDHVQVSPTATRRLVEVNANRDLGPVEVALARRTAARSSRAPPTEYKGGERYDPPGVYYHKMRGQRSPASGRATRSRCGSPPAPRSRRRSRSRPRSHKAGDVLVMAAEDYSGNTNLFGAGPAARPGVPELLHDRAGGRRHLVSTSTTSMRTAARRPSPIGVLSHYKASSGTRATTSTCASPTQPGGTGNSKLMDDEVIAVRDYLNDHGSVLSPASRRCRARGLQLLYNPLEGQSADDAVVQVQQTRWARATRMTRSGRRRTASSSPTTSSSTTWARGSAVIAATDDDVSTLPFKGSGGPFGTTAFTLNGGDSADNQAHRADVRDDRRASCRRQFPQFTSSRAIGFDRPPAYDPPEGTQVRLRGVQRRGLPAAAAHDRPDRQHHRRAEVQGLLRHRARLRLRVRGGAHRRPGRLDDAARQERAHGHQRRSRLVRHRLEHAPPVPQPLPDQPDPGRATARTPARPACGTPPPATPAASRTGRST